MPTLTADEIPAMIDSPQFAELPAARRTDILERALAEGAQSMAGQWDQKTFQQWGQFAEKARQRVQGMETFGEKAAYVGDVLARTGGDMLKMVGATAAGVSPIAAPRSGPQAGQIVPQVPGKTLLQSAGANAAALATNMADAVLRDKTPVQDELGKLKQQIDQGAFFDHPKGFDGWLTDATGQVRDKAAKYYEDASYAQRNDLLANPQNKELLQNYLMTRSPQAWEALTSNVLRTPGAATMQAERQAIQQDSPLGRSLGKQASQYIGEATDPAELAGMAMGLGAGRAIVNGGQSLLRRGAALAGGVAGEVGSEQVSAFMDDPNMSWDQRLQVAKDSLIAGLGFAGVGAGAQALANRGQTTNVPPQAQEAGANPFAGPIQAPPQPTEAGGVVEPPPPQPWVPGQWEPIETALGTLAPAGSANVIQNFGIQRSPEAQAKAMAEEQQRAQVEATARSLQAKAGNGRPVIPDSPLGGRDILDFVNEHPLNMPRKGTELGTSGQYDWTQGFEMPAYYRKYLVSTERGYAPDQLAQMAYDEGLIAEPTPDALTGAMQDTMRARTQFKAEFRGKAQEMKQAESGQSRFDASQQKAKGKTELGFEDIAPGDTMTIEGEPVTIRKVDYDEDGYLTEVVIEDGKKFGVMSLDPQTRGGILVDAKSYQPRERQPGMSDAIANEDGSVDITVPMDPFATPANPDPPQTITGSNEQTGSEMPVPPPTAAAGAGAGEVTPTNTTATPPATPPATAARTAPAASGGGAAAGQTRSGGAGEGASAESSGVTLLRQLNAALPANAQAKWTPDVYAKAESYMQSGNAADLEGLTDIQKRRVVNARIDADPVLAKRQQDADRRAEQRTNTMERRDHAHYAKTTFAALPANLQMPAVRGPLPSSYGGALPPAAVKAWSGKLRTIHGIRQHLLRSIGLPAAGVGRFTKKALGIYQVKPETIRLQAINDVPVLAHEIGHALHFRVLSDDPAKASDWGGSYDGELNALGAATSAPGYTPDQIRKEGVAEFTRLWLTDGAKARASAPRFAAFFEQQLDERAPQMAKALREGRDMIEDYIAMPAFKKAEAQVVFDPAMEKPKSTWRDWMRSGYTKWFNTLHPIEQVLKRVETAEPSLAAEAQRLAAYTDNHRGGWSSKAHADLFNHQTNLKGERVGESFAAILKDIQPGRAKALSTYLALKRAAEIERSGKRSGFENARLPAAEMKALEAEFEGVRQRLMKWQQNELHLLVESGLLDSKTAQAMREANRDYVPFYRLYERVNGVSFGPESSKNAGGYVDLNSGIKRLKGSDRAIIDPLQSMMKNAFMFRKIAEQNQIGHQFFDLIEQVQGHGQWGEGIKPKMTGKTITHAAVVEKLKEQGVIEDETDLPSDADLTLRLWEAVKRPDTANGEVIVFKNGQRKHYEVKDKLLMEALKTADADAIRLGKFLGPTMTKLATLPTRALRFGATGGPWFALPNFVRDQWIASLQSKTGFLPFVDGIKGAFNVIAKTDAYQRWIEAGGKYHGLTTGTEAFNALLEDALPKERSARGALAELGKPRNWMKAIGEAGRILEEASRVQEFVREERMGMSKMDAANASKAITLNFARAGERARVFNMLIPFLNAQLQQLDVLVNLHKDPKRRGQVISRGLMLITVPSVLTWWLGKDDEEIQNLPEWRKNLFWNLNLKPVAKALGMGEGFILSVPKPFLMGAIYGTSVERLLDYATGRDPNGARKAMMAVVDQLPDLRAMVTSFAGMRPIVESIANYDMYRGRDIVPESMKDMPSAYQYDLSSSETAKLLGKWTSQSPMMIDHLIRGYFATAGQWGTGAIDWGMAKLGVADVPPAPAMSLMERPILNKFSGSPYAANAWLPRFYDAAHEMEGLLRVWTKQSQQMTSAEQAKWWKQHGQEILFYQRTINPQTGLTGAGDVRKAMERVSEIGKAMKEVQANKVMSPELKRQRLIELSNQRNRIAEESYKIVFPKAVRERHY